MYGINSVKFSILRFQHKTNQNYSCKIQKSHNTENITAVSMIKQTKFQLAIERYLIITCFDLLDGLVRHLSIKK